MERICLFGGSFHPIHLGHTYIAARAKQAFSLDKVIFLPCRQSPHKNHAPAPNAQRLSWIESSCAGLPWAEVSDFEFHSPSPSFSWKTALHYSKLHPQAQLFWLMGTDQWNCIESWDSHEYFNELVTCIVFSRQHQPKTYPHLSCLHLEGNHDASSTSIRNAPSSPQSRAWTHPRIYSEIHQYSFGS